MCIFVYICVYLCLDVKMRVRIQYKSHNHVLSNIDSVKASHEERQFDKYFQVSKERASNYRHH